ELPAADPLVEIERHQVAAERAPALQAGGQEERYGRCLGHGLGLLELDVVEAGRLDVSRDDPDAAPPEGGAGVFAAPSFLLVEVLGPYRAGVIKRAGVVAGLREA